MKTESDPSDRLAVSEATSEQVEEWLKKVVAPLMAAPENDELPDYSVEQVRKMLGLLDEDGSSETAL
nr:hypothetical protein [uncultured Pseudoxanthomonas sp.]